MGRPGRVTTPTAPEGAAFWLTAIGPLERTTIWSRPAASRAEPLTTTVERAANEPEASGRSPEGETPYAR